MTKRDYQAIARAIHGATQHRLTFNADPAIKGPVMLMADELTRSVADVLTADNPRFDRARFVEACETGRCKGMPR